MTEAANLALYGHPFSSYTWKAEIALHVAELPFEFRMLDGDHPENGAFVAARGGPWARFPVLADGDTVIFEATAIIEHLALHVPAAAGLIPAGDAGVTTRMLDRVFDNYVMTPVQGIVTEHLPGRTRDEARCGQLRAQLEKSYDWVENWLASTPPTTGDVTLVECAAAPSLFYADWVHEIDARWPRLRDWRRSLNALPPVARCIEEARPYRHFFPLGAPDRD